MEDEKLVNCLSQTEILATDIMFRKSRSTSKTQANTPSVIVSLRNHVV